jgi:uncharacterized protein YjiS (DUF1127 family)
MSSHLNRAITHPHALPPFSRFVFMIAKSVLVWETRIKTRRDLARLDPHLLRDIGLRADVALIECEKPFWRG